MSLDTLQEWIRSGTVPAGHKGRDIRRPAMLEAHSDAASHYSFPDRTREEMIVALAGHESYVPFSRHNGGFVIAWDIKVRGEVTGIAEGFEPNPHFDARWSEPMEKGGALSGESYKDALFWKACRDALYPLEEGLVEVPGAPHLRAEFYTNGRSGGHLVLKSLSGVSARGWAACEMAFDSHADYVDWLVDLDEDALVDLYALVRTVDGFTANPAASVNFALAAIREQLEEAWVEEEQERGGPRP